MTTRKKHGILSPAVGHVVMTESDGLQGDSESEYDL